MLNRLNMVLTLVLLCCALALVNSQYRARQDFIELERLQTQRRQLEIDWAQLQLDQSTLGKNARIEEAAEQQNMMLLTSDKTQFIKQGAP